MSVNVKELLADIQEKAPITESLTDAYKECLEEYNSDSFYYGIITDGTEPYEMWGHWLLRNAEQNKHYGKANTIDIEQYASNLYEFLETLLYDYSFNACDAGLIDIMNNKFKKVIKPNNENTVFYYSHTENNPFDITEYKHGSYFDYLFSFIDAVSCCIANIFENDLNELWYEVADYQEAGYETELEYSIGDIGYLLTDMYPLLKYVITTDTDRSAVIFWTDPEFIKTFEKYTGTKLDSDHLEKIDSMAMR